MICVDNEILLFPGTAPGSERVSIEEITFEEPWEGPLNKQIVQYVTAPTIIPFLPAHPNGTAILVIPGGGFKRQVLNLEGADIAKWLNSLGFTAFVLKHRMPGDGHVCGVDVGLQDAQRAMRWIRSQSAHYGIDPNRIGAMGFSAGGHLASALGTCFDRRVYEPLDEIDVIIARPDFLMLCYPCITMKAWEQAGLQSPERTSVVRDMLETYSTDELVTEQTPATFIMVADDDTVTPPEHGVNFYLALRRARVSAELHIYRAGGHGFGMGITRGAVQEWTTACKSWLESVTAR
jgi:acetyl esterase/lipase